MGKIVAVGGGRYDGEIQNIIEYIASLADKKKPSVLFLPTAGFDDINGDEIIKESFEKIGCSFDILFLTDKLISQADIFSKIMGADIIYAGGGNLKFLMDTWNSTGASKILKQAFDEGIVLSGYSSGAMCWFERGYDDCGENGSFMFYDCLGILPGCCCPHYQGSSWQSFKTAVKNQDLSGVAIENGAAVSYVDGVYSTMHGNDDGNVFLLDSEKGFSEIMIDAELAKKL